MCSRQSVFCLSDLQRGSKKILSMHRPRPTIEMCTPASVGVVTQAEPVNRQPLSMPMISGGPKRAMVYFKATTQKLACTACDNCLVKTFRAVKFTSAISY